MNKKGLRRQRAQKRKQELIARKQLRQEQLNFDYLHLLPVEDWVNIFMQMTDATTFQRLASTCRLLYNISRNTSCISRMYMTRFYFSCAGKCEYRRLKFQATVDGKFHGPVARVEHSIANKITYYNFGVLHGWKTSFNKHKPYKAVLYNNGNIEEVRLRIPNGMENFVKQTPEIEGPSLRDYYNATDCAYSGNPFRGEMYVSVRTSEKPTAHLRGYIIGMLTLPSRTEANFNRDVRHIDVIGKGYVCMTVDIIMVEGKCVYVTNMYQPHLSRRVYTFDEWTLFFEYYEDGNLKWYLFCTNRAVNTIFIQRRTDIHTMDSHEAAWLNNGEYSARMFGNWLFQEVRVIPKLVSLLFIKADYREFVDVNAIDKVLVSIMEYVNIDMFGSIIRSVRNHTTNDDRESSDEEESDEEEEESEEDVQERHTRYAFPRL